MRQFDEKISERQRQMENRFNLSLVIAIIGCVWTFVLVWLQHVAPMSRMTNIIVVALIIAVFVLAIRIGKPAKRSLIQIDDLKHFAGRVTDLSYFDREVERMFNRVVFDGYGVPVRDSWLWSMALRCLNVEGRFRLRDHLYAKHLVVIRDIRQKGVRKIVQEKDAQRGVIQEQTT